jgi:nitrite reductase (NO-forming)
VSAAGHAAGEPASKMSGSTAMGSMDMGGASTSSGAGASAGSTDAKIDFAATPTAGWHAFSAGLAPAPGGRVHHLTLVAQDRRVQVAPGVTQDRWTFAGQVPAPTLRGHIGDVFEVTLVNHTDMAHSIDFHAAGEPMQAMRQVAPGRSVTYQFKARYSGIFLYHCGTAPVLMHLANGMYGAVIIDPRGLPRVAHEFLLVQSELYLGPEGQSGDYSKMLHNTPDAVVFNGYSNQYLYSPLHVRVGQTVRIWVLDAGPNDEASFHVVGAPFTTVYKEGAYLLRPGPLHGASQALDLSPGQGGFVQFTPAAPGEYELIDHQLDHAATGADGYLIARR